MTACRICPRQCGAARSASAGDGVCGMGSDAVVARAALHMWEEPCISGARGSGAVFFSGCNLRCVFCQNTQISAERFGARVSAADGAGRAQYQFGDADAFCTRNIGGTAALPAAGAGGVQLRRV